jgi:hypothetical protein
VWQRGGDDPMTMRRYPATRGTARLQTTRFLRLWFGPALRLALAHAANDGGILPVMPAALAVMPLSATL